VPLWRISRNYKNMWNSTKDNVTTGTFVTCSPRGAKPQVKGAQGPAGRPNPMVVRPYFELVPTETWRLCSHVGSQEYPIPESWWKPEGVAGRPCGWPPGHPSPPNQLNLVGGSSPQPIYKDPHGRIHTHHTLLVVSEVVL
jgi:hypothetical protein